MRGSSMGEQQQEAPRIVLTNYAILENGNWYAVISFHCRSGKIGKDEVLRTHPCKTPEDALVLGHQYIDLAHR